MSKKPQLHKQKFSKEKSEQKNKKPEREKTSTSDTLEGVFSVGKNDIGYVRNKKLDKVIQVPKHHWSNALNKDTVLVKITDKKDGVGEVTDIIRRAKVGFAGTLSQREDYYLFTPAERNDPEIIIPSQDPLAQKITKQSKNVMNEKVFVVIDTWNNVGPVGHVDRILGITGQNDTEMIALALERGFDDVFSDEVLREAEQLKEKESISSEIAKRRDFRTTTTFTIDPEDAKDFDDALSFKKLENGNYEIGIHIADVSHYVTPGSALDEEAKRRTTSVYLVDRTIPMLPEVLSNDLCSLRPNEEKLTYAAVFEIKKNGDVINEWFGRTVIKSDKRFTYQEAQEVIDTKKGPFFEELHILNEMAKSYTKNRMENGALSLETGEVKFVLDENGKPLKVQEKTRIDTMRMIEEFMLLANRHVAKFMSEKAPRSIFVYRIHDKPAEDRTHDLRNFLKGLGYKVPLQNGVIPTNKLNELIKTIKNEDKKAAVQTAIVRSMAKAIYSTENIGHYGLGFHYYTHFTSPIRRYPDVMVHRLITKLLTKKPISDAESEEYQQMVNRSSVRERDAQEAEWGSIKYKQIEYMSDRIGQTFEGIITGVMAKGMFVAERISKSEGLIQLRDIPGDYFSFDEKKLQIIGKKTKKKYQIGDIVRIKVMKTDLEKRFIDYALLGRK